MATPDMTLWDKQALSFTTNTTTGRVALSLAGTVVAELGDTGERDISGSLQNVTSVAADMLVIQRVGKLVVVKASVTPNASGNVVIMDGLGSGFAPSGTRWDQGRGGPLGISHNGVVYINPAVSGTAVSATLAFVTNNPWPSSLPGVPFGQPIVVP